MKSFNFFCSFWVLFGAMSNIVLYAQEKHSVDLTPLGSATSLELKLADAIERGIKMNPDLLQQKLNLRSSELYYEDAKAQMYVPSVYFGISSNYITKFGKIHGPTNLASTEYQNSSSQSVELALGQYTLYNFGKDKLVYDQANLDWTRAKNSMKNLSAV